MHLDRSVPALLARAALLAAVLAATSAQTPPPAPDVRLTFADPVFSFAPACDLAKPIVFMALHAKNVDTVAAPFRVDATDATGTLQGVIELPALAPGAVTTLSVPLKLVPGASPASLPGQHVITVWVHGRSVRIALGFPFPAGFCPPAAPGAGTAPAHALDSITAVSRKGRYDGLAMMKAITPPSGVRSVASGTDCGAHVGPLGALVCPDMMKSGDLLLIWDWQAGDGFGPVDGYRVYTGNGVNVNGGGFVGQLVATRPGTGVTLFDVPKPHDGRGYGGHCYAITAYAASRESKPSVPFCAGGGETARSASFTPVRQASIKRSTYKYKELGTEDNLARLGYAVVGYKYMAAQHITGDSENAEISRYAMQFDVTRIAGRKVFEAHVTLDILSGGGGRPDCTTSVALGTSDWWTERWPDAAIFGSPAMTVKNNQLSIDVTAPVTNWAGGRFNQGIILRNDDENLQAFQNKACESYYRNPVLAVTYY